MLLTKDFYFTPWTNMPLSHIFKNCFLCQVKENSLEKKHGVRMVVGVTTKLVKCVNAECMI